MKGGKNNIDEGRKEQRIHVSYQLKKEWNRYLVFCLL
jgi:hypothetical protein